MLELIVVTKFANGDELTVHHANPKQQLTQDEEGALQRIPGVVSVTLIRQPRAA